MRIEKGTSVAVVINRSWANLHGVRGFLRQNQTPQLEIRGTDETHIVFAKVLDAEDTKGLWIELNSDKHKDDPSTKRFSLLVPWNQILTIVVGEEFSPEIWEEAKKVGFTSE
jgi:hypothetical protein